MYDFKDTQRRILIDSTMLPAEAVNIDGLWLDTEFYGKGYKVATLYATGREALSQDIDLGETKNNGAIYKGRRYPERTIIVGIQILADDAESFRNGWNRLAGLLNKEEVTLIFADEPDKYFKAHPGNIEPPEKGKLNGTFELEFICTDPFKYEYNAENVQELSNDENTVPVGGTIPVRPKININFGNTIGSDCNYVEIYNRTINRSLVFGNINADTYLTNAILNTDYMRSLPSLFAENPQTTFQHGDVTYTNNNTTAIYTDENTQFRGYQNSGQIIDNEGVQLTADLSGLGTQAKSWHTMANFKVKQNNHSGSREYIFYRFTDTTGAESMKIFIRFQRSNVYAALFLYGSLIDTYSDDREGINGFDIMTRKTDDGIKIVLNFYGNIGTSYFTWQAFNKDLGLGSKADRILQKIHYHFYAKNLRTITDPPILGFGEKQVAYIAADNLDNYTFIPGDKLTCDCNSGKIQVNNTDGTEYGDLKNDWENFILTPGTNSIIVDYDDHATVRPDISLEWIEGWI